MVDRELLSDDECHLLRKFRDSSDAAERELITLQLQTCLAIRRSLGDATAMTRREFSIYPELNNSATPHKHERRKASCDRRERKKALSRVSHVPMFGPRESICINRIGACCESQECAEYLEELAMYLRVREYYLDFAGLRSRGRRLPDYYPMPTWLVESVSDRRNHAYIRRTARQ